jgi:hypothetical protein
MADGKHIHTQTKEEIMSNSKSAIINRIDQLSDSDEMFQSMMEMVFGFAEPIVSAITEQIVYASRHIEGAFNPMAVAS